MSESKKGNKKVTIVTHSSGFHTDDVFAVATLSLVLGDNNIDIIRSRDAEVILKGDYVVDVGSIYDENNNRFDHHQEGGAGIRYNGVPYASFGLVWKKFGEKLCGSIEVANKIDKKIVQPIDANDNGLQFLETKIPDLYSFDIGSAVHIFYPTWKENIENIDDIFLKLITPAKELLSRAIVYERDGYEAKELVLKAYNESEDKRLVVLDNSRYLWEEVLMEKPEVLYVVYKNISNDNWSIKCVRTTKFSYESRKRLPESWAGKSGEELEKITGVEDSVFCHNARFLAVNKTKEGILKMAEIALNS